MVKVSHYLTNWASIRITERYRSKSESKTQLAEVIGIDGIAPIHPTTTTTTTQWFQSFDAELLKAQSRLVSLIWGIASEAACPARSVTY